MTDDFRSRVQRVEDALQSEEDRREALIEASFTKLRELHAQLLRFHKQIPELKYRPEPKLIRSEPPRITVEHPLDITYDVESGTWGFLGAYKTSQGAFEAYKDYLARWVVSEYPAIKQWYDRSEAREAQEAENRKLKRWLILFAVVALIVLTWASN